MIDLVLAINPDAVMVIKSTIPVGYTRSLYMKYAIQFSHKPELREKKFNLLFSPEFCVRVKLFMIIFIRVVLL